MLAQNLSCLPPFRSGVAVLSMVRLADALCTCKLLWMGSISVHVGHRNLAGPFYFSIPVVGDPVLSFAVWDIGSSSAGESDSRSTCHSVSRVSSLQPFGHP